MSKPNRPLELTIPPPARRDRKAVEVLRAWIAEEGLHCSLRTGLRKGDDTVTEPIGWGVLLADVTRHVADALLKSEGRDKDQFVRTVRQVFNNELDKPTATPTGDFVG